MLNLFERELALLAAVQVESLEESEDSELESETRFQKVFGHLGVLVQVESLEESEDSELESETRFQKAFGQLGIFAIGGPS